ncbi:hypothetical protein KKF17_03250, partial [Patescibacteria group bacterium]|nr:hypothetical protein [Patescibacteria group bacterium]
DFHNNSLWFYIEHIIAFFVGAIITGTITGFLLDRLWFSKGYYDFNPFKLKFGFKRIPYQEKLRTIDKPANFKEFYLEMSKKI